MKNPTTVFASYQPQQSAVAILAQAHAAVIDELLDASLAVEAINRSPVEVDAHFARAVAQRFRNAMKAHYFVSRSIL